MQLSGGPSSASTAPLPVHLTQIDEGMDLCSTINICPALTIWRYSKQVFLCSFILSVHIQMFIETKQEAIRTF